MASLRMLAALGVAVVAGATSTSQPNIITVMIDDMGWSDVGWHDNSFSTPTLNQLAENGVVLERFYTAPTCTPSRSQFMSGRYNLRVGMQDSVIHSTEPRGVPLTEKFLSTKLQDAGYATVAIGKWHMGMHMDSYLPLKRGFDYHYGIYTGGGSHTGHFSVSQSFTVRGESDSNIWQGYNLWENDVVSADNYGTTHSTHLYSAKAVEYMEKFETEDDEQPFFMYLAFQAIHDPITVGDEKYITGTSCNDITEPTDSDSSSIDWDNRKILCGMVAEIDDGMKSLVLGLKQFDEWDNTFIMVFSDNGGVQVHGSSNLPLRGEKADYWEGGVRVPAFLAGGYVESSLKVNGVSAYHSNDMVHISDLHTTLLQLAGYTPSKQDEEKPLDGISHLDSWLLGGSAAGVAAPRSELLININSAFFGGSGALISGEYKLMVNPEPSESKIYAKTKKALAGNEGKLSASEFSDILTKVHEEVLGAATKYLINIKSNPFEVTDGECDDVVSCSNLYGNPDYAEIQADLERKWASFETESVDSTFKWEDDGPLADPELFGGVWTAWRDGDDVPKAQYFGSAVLSDTEADEVADSLMGVHTSTTAALVSSTVQTFTTMSQSVGAIAGLFTVFAGIVGVTAYNAGKRHAYSVM